MNKSIESPNATELAASVRDPQKGNRDPLTHPAWKEFVRFCEELGFGEVEKLKIQDGLPVLAEVTRKKVKFT